MTAGHLRFKVRKVRRIVEQGSDRLPAAKEEAERIFARHFNEIDEKLRKDKAFGHLWSEYGETFVHSPPPPPPANDDHIVVQNTVRPDTYFNLASVTYGNLNLSFWKALPNWFVGIGLIFTFIGLAAALYFAVQGLDATANQDVMQQRLSELLGAATVKFTTSVAGLLCSLVLSIATRIAETILSAKITRLCHSIERRLRVITQEKMAAEQLQQMKAQTKQLEEFNQSFATSLAEALEASFTRSISQAFDEPLQNLDRTIKDITRSASSSSEGTLQKIADNLRDTLQQGAGQEMQAITRGLNSVQSALSEVTENLKQSGGDFGTRIEASVSRIEQAINTSQGALTSTVDKTKEQFDRILTLLGDRVDKDIANVEQGMTAAAARAGSQLENSMSGVFARLDDAMTPMSEGLSGLTETLNKLDESLKRQNSSISSSSQHFTSLHNSLTKLVAEMSNAGIPLRDSAQHFDRAAGRVEESSKAIAEAQDRMNALTATFNESARETRNIWQEYQSRFTEVDASLAGAFEKLIQGSTSHQGQVAEHVREIDKYMSNATSSLAGAVKELGETIEELNENLEKYSGRAVE